jgi:microcystin-dependent protein
MRTSAAFLAVPLVVASASAALAGSEQAFDNLQPSLALTLVTPSTGSFPDGTAALAQGATPGFVYDFAGDFAPRGALVAAGQSLFTSSNPALASLFGVTYGGDFINNLNLPNIVGSVIVGAGGGLNLGAAIGSASG